MIVSKFRKGFTLAEVLVTLAVIGVVAALAIPALLNNTNQAELKTALKKSVAVLNQALTMSIAVDSKDGSYMTDNATMASIFRNKLNIISNSTAGNGAETFYTADGMKYTTIKAGGCDSSTAITEAAAKCVMLVDVNGDKGPNTLSSGTNATSYSFKDQYKVIVKTNIVVPLGDTTDVASNALLN